MPKIIILLFLFFSINLNAQDNMQGQKAPAFDLPDQNGKFHRLSDYSGKWLVLYFYPKDDTPGCTTEAKNFTNDYQAIQKLGAVIVGSSLDTVESHKKFEKKYNISYTLLADKDEVMATDYHVISKTPFFHHAKRQTFIINPHGVIVKHYTDVSPKNHSAEVILDLKKIIEKSDISQSGFEKEAERK